jgi:O-antigen ligase
MYAAAPPLPAAALPRAQARPGVLETLIAVACLVQFSEPLIAAWFEAQGAEAPAAARLVWAPIYLAVVGVWLRDWRAGLDAIARTPLLAGLALLAFASAAWSLLPGDTLRRALALAMTMAFAWSLAWRWSWRGLLGVFGAAWAVLIVGSYAVALAMPSVGVMQSEHPGAWGGLWTHKNTLGGLMALGATLLVAAAVADRTRRGRWLLFAALAAGLVLLATGKTALIGLILGAGAVWAGALLRRGPFAAVVVATLAGVAVIVGAALMLAAPDLAAAALGRDPTLTGRTDIWAAIERAIDARPWLGHGYAAFWLADDGPVHAVRRAVGWEVEGAHSGWLDLALGLGGVGVALFAAQAAVTLWRCALRLGDPAAGLWAPAALGVFALYTLGEGFILTAASPFWIVYVVVAAKLAGVGAHLETRR